MVVGREKRVGVKNQSNVSPGRVRARHRGEARVFDREPFLLNLDSGTLDLTTATLRSHSRDDLITKITPVPYEANGCVFCGKNS